MKPKLTPKRMIVLMLVLGVLVIFAGFAWYGWYCQEGSVPGGWCGTVTEHPPWSLLAALATAPALLLTWYWRDQHKRKEIEIAQDGQVTERFTRAVEQLGSKELAIRLGGIYALERIARDSPRDFGTIMDILAAFVRASSESGVLEDIDRIAAVTVIGRRNTDYEKVGSVRNVRTVGKKIDLCRAHLSRADLSGMDLSSSLLVAAILSNADLSNADLSKAGLWGASLEGTMLKGTDLSGAMLAFAQLPNANLSGADLSHAEMEGATVKGADLSETKGLTREQLQSAILDHETKLPPEFADLIPPKPAKD